LGEEGDAFCRRVGVDSPDEDAEGLEDSVPPGDVETGEEVKVARQEDKTVEGLGEEGDAFCRRVGVDSPDEDAFGEGMRDVGQYAEGLFC